MKRFIMLAAVLVSICAALPSPARQEVAGQEAIKAEAVRSFEKMLDLWRDGDYGALYDRTMANGKDTRESFARKLGQAQLKPACCWEKMQDVAVQVKSGTSVTIRAKIGLDAPGGTEHKTKSFRLTKEYGEWRIARSEILSLARSEKSR